MSDARIGSLFSGYGGLDLGVSVVLGGRVVWHCEVEPAACRVLATRFPGVPNLGDITAIDWATVEPVDVLTGGTPCQDLSNAGKRAGMATGTRSNLWVEMREAIAQLRPSLVIWENVRGAYSACANSNLGRCPRCVGLSDGPHDPVLRALGRVLGDLSSLGYDTRWCGLRAADVGAPHGRFRVFIAAWPAADTAGDGQQRGGGAWHGWAGSADDGRAATDSDVGGRGGWAQDPGWGPRSRTAAGGSGIDLATNPQSVGRDTWWTESARLVGGPDAAERCDAPADTPGRSDEDESVSGNSAGQHEWPVTGPGAGAGPGRPAPRVHDLGRDAPVVASWGWGPYAAAIERWERTLGHLAPPPTEPGRTGSRLSPAFVEWLMGLPDGWVTDVPGVTRAQALHLLGNGVVPQQATHALRHLLDIRCAAA